MSAVEYLDVLDDSFQIVGKVPRDEAHDKGLLHRVAHIWVISVVDGSVWVWFQQRAHNKKDFPLLYDVAVGGHIDAGEPFQKAAVREMWEELGLVVQEEDLEYIGAFREDILLPGFTDRELCETWFYCNPNPPFVPGEEVERVVRISLEELVRTECGTACTAAAYTQHGEAVSIAPKEWCSHARVFRELILPALQKRKITDR